MTFAARYAWNIGAVIPPPVTPHVSILYSVASTSDDDIIIALNGAPFNAAPYSWAMTTPVSATIDWGDGTSNTYTTAGNKTHHYSTFGAFTVTITGSCTTVGLEAGNRLGVSSWETGMGLEAISFSLSGVQAPNFTTVPASLPASLKCVRFAYCSTFNSPNVLSWDASQLTNMAEMFMSCASFNQPIGSWDTSNVTSLLRTFNNALAFNQPIGAWDTGSVTSLGSTFQAAYAFNQDISSWDTSSVASMYGTFYGALVFNQPLDAWDTSNVTSIGSMFQSAGQFNQPLNSWNVANVSDMRSVFQSAVLFNQPLHQWNTDAAFLMTSMFYNATAFNQDISMWCVTLVPSLPTLFATNCPLEALRYPQWGTCQTNYLPIRFYNNRFTGAVAGGNLPITFIRNNLLSGAAGVALPITLNGAGVAFTETFVDYPTPYAGTFTPFSVSGATISIAASNSINVINRYIPTNVSSIGFSTEFQITASNPDDAGSLWFLKSTFTHGTISTNYAMAFNPRREAAFDAARRPVVYINGAGLPMGASGLALSTWYRLIVNIVPGVANATTATIYDRSTNAVVSTVTFVAAYPAYDVTGIQWSNDGASGSASSAVQYTLPTVSNVNL